MEIIITLNEGETRESGASSHAIRVSRQIVPIKIERILAKMLTQYNNNKLISTVVI